MMHFSDTIKQSFALKLLVLLAIFLMALVFRIHNLTFDSYFMDEIHQVSFYSLPLEEVHKGASRQQQPPLDYWVGAIVSRFANSDFSLRLPAAIFGALSVVLLCVLIARVSSYFTAIYFSLLASILPYAIYVSQDARPYSIAIFFLLAFILAIDNFYRADKHYLKHFFILLIVTVLFFLTRTLSPLVSIFVTGLFCFIYFINSFVCKSADSAEIKKKMFLMQSALLLALIAAIPYYLQILVSGQRFLSESDSLSVWFSRLDLSEVIYVWIAQLEPNIVLLVIGVLFVLFTIVVDFRKQSFLLKLLAFMLIMATLVHYGIFRFKTDYTFRPGYSIYVWPLFFILSAVGVHRFLEFLKHHEIIHKSFLVLLMMPIFLTVSACIDFKSRHLKSDWRSLSAYTNQSESDNKVFIFEALADKENWNPSFYGSYRYPSKAEARSAAITDFINRQSQSRLARYEYKPVLVFFHYRDYLLTANSSISLLAPSFEHLELNLQDINGLNITKIFGFTLIELEQSLQKNSAEQLYDLIDAVIEKVPEGSSRVNLHLAAAYLTPKENHGVILRHIRAAQRYARNDQIAYLNRALNDFNID